MRVTLRARLALLGVLAVVLSAAPAYGQISETPVTGLSNGRVYRSNVAYDSVNEVYLAIVQRPPVRGRFLDKNGNQIGVDFTIALEPGEPYTGWASVAFGGPSNDPTFIVTYIVADQVTNPKFARLVRYQAGQNPSVSQPHKIADVYTEWLFAEKAQNVWNGGQFIVGTRVLFPGASLPTPQVNLVDLDGTVSGPVFLGDGTDYHGSPAIACSNGGICLAVGFMAGIPSGYSGGTYGRLFNGITLDPLGSLFNVNFGTPNEDQGVVFLSHTGFFLAQWFRGGGPGYIDTRIISPDGTMSTLDMSRGIGPGAGCNYLIYNPGTQTTLLLTKGPSAELLAIELGDDGYPIRPNNILTLTPWDGSVLDYLPSMAANATDGQWLVTAEKSAGAQGWKIQGLLVTGNGPLPINILTGAALPTATEQTSYAKFFIASGSVAPYVWTLQTGTVPPGLTLSGSTLSGTPTTPGTYNFRLRVTGQDAQFAERDFTLIVHQIIVAPPGPSGAQISNGPGWGLWPGNAYRNNVAYDSVNQVYLVIVRRPPVTGRFYSKDGVQIGPDFIIADEPGEPFTAWASIAFGGPPNDPTFIVTYVTSGGGNPKTARFVRYVNGAPSVSPGYHIVNAGSEWLFAEKAQSVWNGQKFIVGTRVKLPGMSLPTFQVNQIELNGTVSAPVDLGNGFDYYGSPALSCAANGVCIAIGFMAGMPTGFSGGTYARLFDGATLAPQGNLFHLASGRPNEDQGVVYQTHTGYFLAQWFRGGGPGFIDTRLIGTNGTMSLLDLSKGIGPNAGTNAFAYNPATRTTLLVTKGDSASLFAMELGDNGYPLNPNNWILITPWDGAVLDYLPSVAANGVDGHWLLTYELAGGGFARFIYGTLNSGGGCSFGLNPTSQGFGAGGGAGNFSVLVSSGCGWTATAGPGWIHTSSSGSGNGTVSYTVDSNGGAARSGSISVGGLSFSISQAAVGCSYSLNPTSSGTLPASESGGLILVTAGTGCDWTPATSQSWIHPSGSGTGSGTAGYTVDANTGAARSGAITIGGQQFTVTQAAAPSSRKAELVGPAGGSTLTSSSAAFHWTGGIGNGNYWIYVGTSQGGFDLLSRDMGTDLSTVVNNLPTNGETIHVRLFSHDGSWQWNDYTLTAVSPAVTQRAYLASPAPGSTLTRASHVFRWTGGVGVGQYWLYVGTSPGAFDLVSRDVGTQLSTVVGNLPTNGQTLYVRLYSHTGSWQFHDYTLTAATTDTKKAELLSPAHSSTLTSSAVTFEWNGGAGVAQYWLYVGTTPGGFDLLSRNMGTQLSTDVSGLPVTGVPIYVRLYSHIGSWQWHDYTLTTATLAPGPQRAQLMGPAPGSTLASSTVTFEWTGGTGATEYVLDLGTAPGGANLLHATVGTQLSAGASGLPTDGSTIHARLYSKVNGVWQFNDYTLTAATLGQQKAQLISPAPGSTLNNSTLTFQWTGGGAMSRYWLYVGTTPGSFDLLSRDMGSALSTVVSNLPANGSTLYVRLHSLNGTWQFNDYTFTAPPSGAQKAELTSPAPSSTLSHSTVRFQWTGGKNVARYWLYVGTTPGSFDLLSRDMGTQLSTVVSGLPTTGQTLHVRLLSHVSGAWQWNDYVLTAAGGEEMEAANPLEPMEDAGSATSAARLQPPAAPGWTRGRRSGSESGLSEPLAVTTARARRPVPDAGVLASSFRSDGFPGLLRAHERASAPLSPARSVA